MLSNTFLVKRFKDFKDLIFVSNKHYYILVIFLNLYIVD